MDNRMNDRLFLWTGFLIGVVFSSANWVLHLYIL